MDTPMNNKIHKYHLCADIGCHFEEEPRKMNSGDKYQERDKEQYAIRTT